MPSRPSSIKRSNYQYYYFLYCDTVTKILSHRLQKRNWKVFKHTSGIYQGGLWRANDGLGQNPKHSSWVQPMAGTRGAPEAESLLSIFMQKSTKI